ncbi:12752_t:CDS:2 [Gigaspora margarita]|uniref:12752_t:CDS:1 n=1 Tax=Gigaspora margarita TaxID=4874 RepID=A0ABN7UGF8_GIGMA|nr:12752_t:CDS:2 [Gigaspora margarita]
MTVIIESLHKTLETLAIHDEDLIEDFFSNADYSIKDEIRESLVAEEINQKMKEIQANWEKQENYLKNDNKNSISIKNDKCIKNEARNAKEDLKNVEIEVEFLTSNLKQDVLDNTHLIKAYLEIVPRVRILVIIIRHWEKQRELGDAVFLKEYYFSFSHEFDYTNNVVSLRKGKYLTKQEKIWNYYKNLCVEEPINTERNLGNSMSKDMY